MEAPGQRYVAGKYIARLKDWGFAETQGGADQIMLCFEFKNPLKNMAPDTIIWFGSFKSEKAAEFSAKVLRLLDLKTDQLHEIVDEAGYPVTGALNTEKEVEIELAQEPDLNGKPRIRVKWVNAVGGAAMQRRLGRSVLRDRLAHTQGALAALKPAAAISQPSFTEDDLPF
jgi:hypothetical protein